jgi:hypothetical protein
MKCLTAGSTFAITLAIGLFVWLPLDAVARENSHHHKHHPSNPVHGPGSSHNPIARIPVHGSGSSHNPIARIPVHGSGSSHNPIVCPATGCGYYGRGGGHR